METSETVDQFGQIDSVQSLVEEVNANSHKGDIGRLASGRVKTHQIATRYTDAQASITTMT